MIPGEILDYATSGSAAHFVDDFPMPIQMLQSGRNRVHIAWLYDHSFNSITDHIASLARGDLRQSARRRFISDLCTAFPLGWENVDCSLVEIILRIPYESDNANIVAPELLQKWLRFVVNKAN